MTTVIHPKYGQLRDFVSHLPEAFATQGTTIYKGRNELKTYETGGYQVVVKQFKKPHLVNRIAYTFFRPSKARRSYEHALELLKRGVPTPEPVAYIEEKRCGLLYRSYYVCVFEKAYGHIRAYISNEKKDEALLRELSAFIAGFHNKGVHYLDITGGNILFKKEGSQYLFSLVDINRMKFKTHISAGKRCKSLMKLATSAAAIDVLAGEYAGICGLDRALTIRKVQAGSSRFFKDYHD